MLYYLTWWRCGTTWVTNRVMKGLPMSPLSSCILQCVNSYFCVFFLFSSTLLSLLKGYGTVTCFLNILRCFHFFSLKIYLHSELVFTARVCVCAVSFIPSFCFISLSEFLFCFALVYLKHSTLTCFVLSCAVFHLLLFEVPFRALDKSAFCTDHHHHHLAVLWWPCAWNPRKMNVVLN